MGLVRRRSTVAEYLAQYILTRERHQTNGSSCSGDGGGAAQSALPDGDGGDQGHLTDGYASRRVDASGDGGLLFDALPEGVVPRVGGALADLFSDAVLSVGPAGAGLQFHNHAGEDSHDFSYVSGYIDNTQCMDVWGYFHRMRARNSSI